MDSNHTAPCSPAVPGGTFDFFDGDFTHGMPGRTFDLVTCVSVIEHVPEDEKFLLIYIGLMVTIIVLTKKNR